MSKKSRRRNKLLLAGAALLGASKLGMLGGKTAGINVDKGRGSELGKKFRTPEKFTKSVGTSTKVNVKKAYPRLKVDSIGNVTKDGVTSVTKNKNTKFVNLNSSKGTGTGIYQGGKKVSGLNQKSINVLKSGEIETGGKTFKNKVEYRKFKDAERLKKRNTVSKKSTKKNPGFFGFTFDKPLLNKGSMVKARGGGMARNKPTKLY